MLQIPPAPQDQVQQLPSFVFFLEHNSQMYNIWYTGHSQYVYKDGVRVPDCSFSISTELNGVIAHPNWSEVAFLKGKVC